MALLQAKVWVISLIAFLALFLWQGSVWVDPDQVNPGVFGLSLRWLVPLGSVLSVWATWRSNSRPYVYFAFPIFLIAFWKVGLLTYQVLS